MRGEAKEFYQRKIQHSQKPEAIDDLPEIKHRLDDPYSEENKAVFLDQFKDLIIADLQNDRKAAHGGKPGVNCRAEVKPDKLVFYINQELGTLPIVAHHKKASNPEQQKNSVFVRYSHSDKEFLADIKRHFKAFLSKIDFWDDTKILPGQKWKEEIEIALAKCKAAILLISADYLGSDFIATD